MISEKQIEDNTIRTISSESKALKGHTEQLKEKLNFALQEAYDVKLDQKE